jgi:anti-sigma factor RsiW
MRKCDRMRDFIRHRRQQPGLTAQNHLSDDEFTDYHDEGLSVNEQTRLAGHLSRCPECREKLEALRATITLLRSAPQITPRVSFQIAAEDAFRQRKWERFLSRFIPRMPALQAATVGVFVLLLAVTATDQLSNNGAEQAGKTRSSTQPTAVSRTVQEGGLPPTAATREDQAGADEPFAQAEALGAVPTAFGESDGETLPKN